MAHASLQDRTRQRLRALVDTKEVSHTVLGKYLGLSRSAVTRLLNKDGAILLPHLEKLCEFFQVTPAELVSDPGAVILPVSPLESSLLDRFRRMTEMQRMALMAVLDWRGELPVAGRRRKDLSHDEAVLVALWQAAERVPDVQSAVLDLLRQHPAVAAARRSRRVEE